VIRKSMAMDEKNVENCLEVLKECGKSDVDASEYRDEPPTYII
jgi:hypothetical protein